MACVCVARKNNLNSPQYIIRTCNVSHKAHTDRTHRTQFANETRFFDFQKQIKQLTERDFVRYVHKIAEVSED